MLEVGLPGGHLTDVGKELCKEMSILDISSKLGTQVVVMGALSPFMDRGPSAENNFNQKYHFRETANPKISPSPPKKNPENIEIYRKVIIMMQKLQSYGNST